MVAIPKVVRWNLSVVLICISFMAREHRELTPDISTGSGVRIQLRIE
jgi:hypothetical protein